MKAIKTNVLLMIFATLFIFSCDKKDDEPTPLRLKVNVKHDGINIKGANVLVYEKLSDLKMHKNIVAKGLTDTNGLYFFKGIEKNKRYFVDIEKDCFNNYISLFGEDEKNYKTKFNEKENTEEITVNTMETGGEQGTTFFNLTDNTYELYINYEPTGLIIEPYSSTSKADYLPTENNEGIIIQLKDTNTNTYLDNSSIFGKCGDNNSYTIE